MFFNKIRKINVYPCKPQFYCIKVGFKGVKIIQACFRNVYCPTELKPPSPMVQQCSTRIFRLNEISDLKGTVQYNLQNQSTSLFTKFMFVVPHTHCIHNLSDIKKTRLHNFDPFKPHFYTVNWGLQGYTLFFLFLLF